MRYQRVISIEKLTMFTEKVHQKLLQCSIMLLNASLFSYKIRFENLEQLVMCRRAQSSSKIKGNFLSYE
jgi:hypothetical protein